MIPLDDADVFVLHLTRRADSARRVGVGDAVPVRIGRTRSLGRVIYQETIRDEDVTHEVAWVRVPMVICPLPMLD